MDEQEGGITLLNALAHGSRLDRVAALAMNDLLEAQAGR